MTFTNKFKTLYHNRNVQKKWHILPLCKLKGLMAFFAQNEKTGDKFALLYDKCKKKI